MHSLAWLVGVAVFVEFIVCEHGRLLSYWLAGMCFVVAPRSFCSRLASRASTESASAWCRWSR